MPRPHPKSTRTATLFPYTPLFRSPVVRRRPLALDRIDARLGRYSYDAGTPIAEGTWTGAYWSAQTALTALDRVLAGERSAFARSEEHTSELQSLMRISYAVFCLKNKT